MLTATFILFAIMVLAILAEGMYANEMKKGGKDNEENVEFF
jgi:hypothetical protein